MTLTESVRALLADRGHPAPWRVYALGPDIWLLDARGIAVLSVPTIDLAAAICYAVNVAAETLTAEAQPIHRVDPTVPDPRD